MFDLGFEPQIRSLLGQIRPDRQTLLFSATMPRRVEHLAADALISPVRITVGATGAANEDVTQTVHVLENEASKRQWLINKLPEFIDEGEVLIFANQKAKVEDLCASLGSLGIARIGAIHGDLSQVERMDVLSSFRDGKFHVLVATDVAARGLDIKTLKTVINYDAAKDIDTHVHRVGRTGRAGDKEGAAHTLVLPTEIRAAVDLERCLAAAGQDVPAALHKLALKDPRGRRKGGFGGSGGSGRGSGKGRGRGGGRGSGGGFNKRGSMIGGSGLGFNSDTGGGKESGSCGVPVTQEKVTVHIPGFAPSHAGEDAHFINNNSNVANPQVPSGTIATGGPRNEGTTNPLPLQLPPPSSRWGNLPPPPPIATSAAVPLRSSGTAAIVLPPPPMPPPPIAPPYHAQHAQHAEHPPQRLGPAAEAVAMRQIAVGQSFQSSFVSSGMRQGDVGVKPEIVLPKIAPALTASGRPLPPPPVPVTQRPLYMQPRPQYGNRGYNNRGNQGAYGGSAGHLPQQQQQQQQPTAAQAADVQRAIAQARAIAARLVAQGPGGRGAGAGGSGGQGQGGGQSRSNQ